jgi:hypothetical protein
MRLALIVSVTALAIGITLIVVAGLVSGGGGVDWVLVGTAAVLIVAAVTSLSGERRRG